MRNLYLHQILLLGATGGVADIASLLPCLPPHSSDLGMDAARAAADILQRATVEDISWLERHRRTGEAWMYTRSGWEGMSPSDLGVRIPDGNEPQAAVVTLASMHSSGYVREHAVRLLAGQRNGRELPFLLVRVNDWVEPVREAAKAAVRERLVAEYAKHFVRCLTLVEDLRGERRAPHRALIGEIETLLCTQVASPALDQALQSGGRELRRACVRIAAKSGDPALLRRAALDSDPIVATAAARAITATWSAEALREVLPRLRVGPPAMRCLALKATCDRFPSEAEPYLRRSLVDDTSSVRELARFLWQKTGQKPLDFAAFYRNGITESKGRAFAAVLYGLAETGGEADAPLFEPYLKDARAAVRAAAVTGIGRCGRARYSEALLAALNDSNSRVAGLARRWVRLHVGRAQARRLPRRVD
ncbi:MAG: hypothetical protein IPK82_44165 [Polyangiaceae bacterium]|nr:hypothetical protein [Polyangiaceae bacterium]